MGTPENKLTGGRTNYYLVQVPFPQREEQAPYQAECEDIIEALQLTPNEANIFKAIWRSANARLDNGKPDHQALYDAEKIVHYAQRNLRAHQIKAGTHQRIEPKQEVASVDQHWVTHDDVTNLFGGLPDGIDRHNRVEVVLRNGAIRVGEAGIFDWVSRKTGGDIMKWRLL